MRFFYKINEAGANDSRSGWVRADPGGAFGGIYCILREGTVVQADDDDGLSGR